MQFPVNFLMTNYYRENVAVLHFYRTLKSPKESFRQDQKTSYLINNLFVHKIFSYYSKTPNKYHSNPTEQKTLLQEVK